MPEGKVEARVDSRLPLERASGALGLLASGKASGKVVLVPGFESGKGVAEPSLSV